MLAKTYWSHVAPKGGAYILNAGQGYQVGIANQSSVQYNGQNYTHTKRIMRFTMRPNAATWNDQERATNKTAPIEASVTYDDRNAVHSGWNLVGNPFLDGFALNNVSGLRVGAWKKEMKDDKWTGWYIPDGDRAVDVPYLTVYNPETREYSQMLASSYRSLRPFEAVFVQINEGTCVEFSIPSAVRGVKRRSNQLDTPFYTGIILSGENYADRTGVVLCDEYTKAYEIGADLSKTTNDGKLNLYTINSNSQPLAFNAMSDEDAVEPIPVGATFPYEGVYTFSFDAEQYSLAELEELQLIDHVENTVTDLLHGNYEFFAQPGTDDKRFALLIRRTKQRTEQDTTTGLTSFAEDGGGETHKIIRNGILYILRDGKLYNALGAELR